MPTVTTSSLSELLREIKGCRVCEKHLPHEPRPILAASETARLLLVGQAPGRRVHETGIPWNDPSGDNLRRWLNIPRDVFYDRSKIAIVPAGFCYPGTVNGSDLPPRPECAPLWHPPLAEHLSQVRLTLLIGQYAQAYYLGERRKATLTETVRAWKSYLPRFLPMPHPSPRNRLWLRRNPWFEREVVPFLQKKVAALVLSAMLLFLGGLAGAASTDWQTNVHGRVRLLSLYNVAPKSGEMLLALQFRPAPGWYYYWKDPGEAGLPPRMDWSKTEGLAPPEILFPQPTKLVLPGDIVEYGYEGETVYPIRATIQGKRIRITAKLAYLTCDTSCVPYTYTFHLNMACGERAVIDTEAQDLIQAALARVPSKDLSDAQIKANARVVHKIPGQPASSEQAHGSAMAGMLIVAFLGGLILNVMPCVLPVLSIKLTGLLQHSGQSASNVVKSALASAAGILVSFESLALLAVAARRAGHAIGWGIQFQNHWFVLFLLVVVLLFALNLWGIYEINTPLWVGHFATTYGYHETLPAHFMSGLFATLLATPCSAPFLGTAMGFALGQSSSTILAIFFAVGAGMALPYFVLAVFPHSIVWLPKPSAWMLYIKKVLSLFLLATAAWLGWVLFQQLKPPAASAPGGSAGELIWVAFDESAIDRYLKEGKPVFVDVTADWCVTCKFNERFVLSDRDVVEMFKRQHVILMKADWTNRDPVIANYLMKHGRAGIPFYAFYRPGRPPVLLSEFLTKAKVLSALTEVDDSAVAWALDFMEFLT